MRSVFRDIPKAARKWRGMYLSDPAPLDTTRRILGQVAFASIPQKPRRHFDGPRGPTRPPIVSPRAPRRQPEATARQPGIPTPPAAAQGKEIQAIQQPYPAFHRNLDGTSTAPAAPRDRRWSPREPPDANRRPPRDSPGSPRRPRPRKARKYKQSGSLTQHSTETSTALRRPPRPHATADRLPESPPTPTGGHRATARDPHAARGHARQGNTSNPAALPSIPQKPRRHFDG
eukprot:gene14154-biopygen4014